MAVLDMSFAQAVQKKLLKEFEVLIPSEQDYYSHPTFVVSGLAEYIRLIAAISSINKDSSYSETVVYRGMADTEYDLLPGLARIKKPEHEMEATLINDFLTRRPDAFSGLAEFDTLAKMQHYGLPTRLLDFSLNPLVALYFACETKTAKSGRVLCHSTYIKNDSSEYVNTICTSTTKKMFDDNYTVEEYYCNDKLSLRKYLSEAYIYDETTVVRPKYWNQRIANQAGVFMVFPNHLIDRYRCILIHESELGIDMAIREYGRGKIDRAIIEEALNREPIEYYRNEPGPYLTDAGFMKMREAYKNNENFWIRMENRFKITEKVKPLSQEKISSKFCSIIIEPKNKKKILRDLSYIGFRADYIYPELEYTAQEIKRRFE